MGKTIRIPYEHASVLGLARRYDEVYMPTTVSVGIIRPYRVWGDIEDRLGEFFEVNRL